MNVEDLNWKTWLKHGDQYLKSATPKSGNVTKFGPEIRYNILSMSLEGYIMAILDYHHSLPENHTYTDLINALENIQTLEKKLKDRILKYENIQSICSVEKFHINSPKEEELTDLRGAIVEIADMAHHICGNKS